MSDSLENSDSKPVEVDTGSKSQSDLPSKWTFLSNHAHVLIVLNGEPNLTLREVSTRVGITERAVQRIIRDLEGDGFLQIDRVGRKNQYRVKTEKSLRHPIEAHRSIGDLLRLITG